MRETVWKAVLALNLVLAIGVGFLASELVSAHRALAAAPVVGADPWGPYGIGGPIETLTAPGQKFVEVTPSDDDDLPLVPRAISSYDGGDIVCVDRDGTEMTALFAAGEIKPLRCRRITTDSTATDIWAIY